MRTIEALKSTRSEQAFAAAFALAMIMLPVLGITAERMSLLPALALIVYTIVFHDVLRQRGWLKVVVITAIAATVLSGFILLR